MGQMEPGFRLAGFHPGRGTGGEKSGRGQAAPQELGGPGDQNHPRRFCRRPPDPAVAAD